MRRDRFALLSIFCALAPLPAAELVVRDVGLRIETLPTEFRYEAVSDGFSRSGTDYLSSHLGLAAGGRYSFAGPGSTWGPVLGADLALMEGRSAAARLQEIEARGVAGLGMQLGLAWTALIQVTAGIGYGRMSLDAVDGSSAGELGSLTPGLALWWRTGERARLTVEAGWRTASAVLRHGGTDIDIRQSGATIGIGFTWGLSRAPWSLE